MKRLVKNLFLGHMLAVLCLVMSSTGSSAATTQVDCSSSSTVQTALNNAASGDTVQCSAGGTYSWSRVTIPSTKNITLDGNGATISGTVVIASTASYFARVTNFTFRTDDAIFAWGDSITNKPWRLDHCTFDASGTSANPMITTGIGPGLIDHVNFTNIPFAKETIHNMGWGASNTAGWNSVDAVPGSPNALYIEDCTATGAQGNASNLIQNYYGSRVVVRHNTLNAAMVDAHGNNTPPSARWFEIYDNTITNGTVFCIRGGSGVIFGNTGAHNAFFVNETTSPLYKTGYGQNSTLYPAYLWDNAGQSNIFNSDGCSVHAGWVVPGTEVIEAGSGTSLPATCSLDDSYWKTDERTLYKCTATNTWTAYYKPYTYPHPLTNGRMTNAVKPNPPSSLTIE